MKVLNTKVNTHLPWQKFYNWIVKTFGNDLKGEVQIVRGVDAAGKNFTFKYQTFNDFELSRRLIGYDVIEKVEKYIKRYCPEIKIVYCDDSFYSGSILLLIPHPFHGITIIFIPQTTNIQNQFFLYENHLTSLLNELNKMKSIYKKK